MSLYFAASGLAWIKGIETFEDIMPQKRFYALLQVYNETKGFRWVDKHFINTIICIAGREASRPCHRTPSIIKGCQYRMKYCSLQPQKNALRVEIMAPADRCGWALKRGRVGGRPDDYHPCVRF